MKYKTFSEEEIQILLKNPNTLSATKYQLRLTLDAKKKVYELSQSKVPVHRILRELGYDAEMLGIQRVKNFIRNIKQEAASKNGLHQGSAPRKKRRLTADQIAELEENPESYARLKNEVIYLREEVEFLKKISQQVISGKRDK